MSVAEVEAAWPRVEAWLGVHAPPVLASLHPGATEAQLVDAEAAFGRRLPEEVRATFRRHDGQEWNAPPIMDVIWQLHSLETAVDDWRVKEGVFRDVFQENEEDDTDATCDAVGPVHPIYWRSTWFPLLYDGGGNSRCVDLDPPEDGTVGQIISMDHEVFVRKLLAPGIGTFLATLAGDMEAGRYAFEQSGTHGAVCPVGWRNRPLGPTATGD